MGERRELSGTWAQKVELYFSALYAVNQLVLCTGNKLDNKIWFITQGGNNQEFTLGLEGFLKLAFIFVVIKLKIKTFSYITGRVLVASFEGIPQGIFNLLPHIALHFQC